MKQEKIKFKQEIPIVFATDDNYAPFLGVALRSILETGSKDNYHRIYILNTNISEKNIKRLLEFECENLSIEFVDVTKKLDSVGTQLPLRDYYTNTIYYRIFIPSLFPEHDKMLYLDCDVILLEDVANLFNTKIEGKLMGVIPEDVMANFDIFGVYSEEVLNISRYKYFNSGVLVMNTKEMREYEIEKRFVNMLKKFKFEVAPDQDYLNVLCTHNISYIDLGWNKSPIPFDYFEEENLKLAHYKINWKPWHYENVRYEKYFWENAKKTSFYEEIKEMLANYGDKEKQKDLKTFDNLVALATRYIKDPNNYKKTILRKEI